MIRELFHELGEAAFEAAKELGEAFEAAMTEAAKPPAPTVPPSTSMLSSIVDFIQRDFFHDYLRHRFNWEGCTIAVVREAVDLRMTVWVRRPCRHRFAIPIDEELLLSCRGMGEMLEAMMYRVEAVAEQNVVCDKCVKAMQLGPAGAR